MKVIAILGGLGSQMFKYSFYLQVVKNSKDKNCLIDTSAYLQDKIWNGYELNRIFSIQAPDIINYFSEDDIKIIMRSKFPAKYFVMNKILFSDRSLVKYYNRGFCDTWRYLDTSDPFSKIRNSFMDKAKYKCINNYRHVLKNVKSKFQIYGDKYYGKYLTEKYSLYFDEFNHNSDKYFIDCKNEIIKAFEFKTFNDITNIKIQKEMEQTESVAIHFRRGDHMYDNIELYKTNYFIKGVNYIKSKVSYPKFYLFSDDINWIKFNLNVSGLNIDIDSVVFVDWNIGSNSYKDMQLMTSCKHNILSISSFGWWGYYLSTRNNKLVCAPKGYWLEVPVHL